MMNSVSNIGFNAAQAQTAIPQQGQYMYQPYQSIATAGDTVTISKKESSTATKAAVGVAGTLAVVAGALLGLNKTGVLKSVENPSGVLQKLQNLAVKAGGYLSSGLSKVTNKISALIKKAPSPKEVVTASTEAVSKVAEKATAAIKNIV